MSTSSAPAVTVHVPIVPVSAIVEPFVPLPVQTPDAVKVTGLPEPPPLAETTKGASIVNFGGNADDDTAGKRDLDRVAELVDDLRAGKAVTPTRGAAAVCSFKEVSRVLAGFDDGRAGEGVGAGEASLIGLRLVYERNV